MRKRNSHLRVRVQLQISLPCELAERLNVNVEIGKYGVF